MHPAALRFFGSHVAGPVPGDVLEFGSRNLNGGLRSVLDHRSWYGIDVVPGDGVDEVADAATWRRPGTEFDLVVCAEVFEHTAAWPKIIRSAYEALRMGGTFLATCATGDRPPHSALDGGELRPGEWYANVGAWEMTEVLEQMGWWRFTAAVANGHFGNDDLQVKAVR